MSESGQAAAGQAAAGHAAAGQRLIGDAAVGPIGVGGASWSFASDRDRERAFATVAAAYDAGVRYFDTAAAYTTDDEPRHNEQLVAEALRRLGSPSDVVVGTKGGHFRRGGEFPIDGRAASIRSDCEASLVALGVDSIDLYLLHWPDPKVPFAESVGALEQLRSEGKTQRTGLSNVTLEQLLEALEIGPIAAVENVFSPFQTRDRELIGECARLGVAYLVYSPLGGPEMASRAEALPETAAQAASLGVSVEQVILAWELSLAPNVIPIAGAGRPATIRDSAAAAGRALDAATLQAVERDVVALSASPA